MLLFFNFMVHLQSNQIILSSNHLTKIEDEFSASLLLIWSLLFSAASND